MTSKLHVAVIGAGAFGGWTALYLLRSGARVTLLDAWGPGNSRASSGGETRVIRGAYGPDQPYTNLAARALDLWKEHERLLNRKFFFPIGVLWMAERNDTFERGSLPLLKDAGIPFEQLPVKELARRWPQINFQDIEWGIYEPHSGYLLARASTQAVVERFIDEGGEYRQASVCVPERSASEADGGRGDRNKFPDSRFASEADAGRNEGMKFRDPSRVAAEDYSPRRKPWVTRAKNDQPRRGERTTLDSTLDDRNWQGVRLSDGSQLTADRYVFACGPWIGKMFPTTIGPQLLSTKQDVFFFGTPAGDARFEETVLPVWAEHSGHFMYGIPGNQGRGFKIGDDTRGPEFDPTSGERVVSAERLAAVRQYLAYRFPGMKNAPLLETRVCQYENTPDHNFIIDRHPANQNVWIVGGGSGHGFKHGPAIGEMVSRLLLNDDTSEALYRLERFRKKID